MPKSVVLGVPQTESTVVFGGQNHVLRTGEFGDRHPLFRFVLLGIKCFGKLVNVMFEIFFVRPDHRVTDY